MSAPFDPNRPPWQQPGQQPGQPYAGYAPAPPKRSWPARHKVLTAVLAVVGLFVVLGVIGAVAGSGTATDPGAASPSAPVVTTPTTVAPTTQPAPEPTTAAPPTEDPTDPAPPAAATIEGTGTFLVGSEVKPGTYRTAGPNSDRKDLSLPCSWQRAKGTSGELGDVIAAGLPSGPAIVTIKASDKAFTSDGCEKWTKVG